jgi:hypothetical protein
MSRVTNHNSQVPSIPCVGVGVELESSVVLCTTTGTGGSRMSRPFALNADDAATPAPRVGVVILALRAPTPHGRGLASGGGDRALWLLGGGGWGRGGRLLGDRSVEEESGAWRGDQ